MTDRMFTGFLRALCEHWNYHLLFGECMIVVVKLLLLAKTGIKLLTAALREMDFLSTSNLKYVFLQHHLQKVWMSDIFVLFISWFIEWQVLLCSHDDTHWAYNRGKIQGVVSVRVLRIVASFCLWTGRIWIVWVICKIKEDNQKHFCMLWLITINLSTLTVI